MPHPVPKYLRKVIRLPATASPNVRRAMWEIENGLPPTGLGPDGNPVVPVMLTWQDYQTRLATWDAQSISVGLNAEFYEGPELLLYPPEWLNLAARRAQENGGKRRSCKGIGCDPAEGGDLTAMCAVDELGVIELVARKTPDTQDVPRELLAFMRRHRLDGRPERVCIDRGGGKFCADWLRREGYGVRTVAFGSILEEDPKYQKDTVRTKVSQRESKYAYRTRRAQMFGELSELLDPGIDGCRFGIPAEYADLRAEMRPIPKTFDNEGRLELIPKNPKPQDKNPDGTPRDRRKSLVGLIGHSPDRLDALALAVHAMLHEAPVVRVGAY